MRKRAAQLVNPQSVHTAVTLQLLGVPTGKDRTVADNRARLAEPGSDKPKTVTGNIDDGTVFNDLLNVLQARNIIVNKAERGGSFGGQLHNAALVNADSPVSLVQAEGSADTASTTNTGSTVSAITMVLDLGVGKWAVSAMGSVILTHSAGATVAVSIEIDTDEGTARTVTSAAAPGVRAFAHLNRVDEINWIQGEQTINVRVRYRSDTAGTTSAKNPQIMALAKRME